MSNISSEIDDNDAEQLSPTEDSLRARKSWYPPKMKVLDGSQTEGKSASDFETPDFGPS